MPPSISFFRVGNGDMTFVTTESDRKRPARLSPGAWLLCYKSTA